MYFKQRSIVLFRNYESFGYITDNRNFGYQRSDDDKIIIGDKILSESGAIFFSLLSTKPQDINSIARKISEIFETANIDTLKNDAVEFYENLEHDGFVVSGETIQECESKDNGFLHKHTNIELINKENSSKILSPEKLPQDFFEEHFKGRPQLTNLHIEITSKCNERCIHCYIPHENKLNGIEPDLFYEILNQCREMKVLHLTLSGGEPMLHHDFRDFLSKCREYNFSVNVLSNLTLLDDEIINEMRRNPLLGVQTSLYSIDSKIHDEITQVQGSCEKTKNAIVKLVENGISLQISCPIMKQNKNSFKEVRKWAAENRIRVGDDYVIIAKYNHSTQNLWCRLSVNEIEEIINNSIEEDENFLEKMETEANQKKGITPDDYICSVCHSSICITENGNVYPCAGWQDYSVGDIRDLSLEDIWNKSERIQYLRGLRRKDFPKCVQCLDKEFCTMCMVRNANEDPMGNPLVVNEFFCSIARIYRIKAHERKDKFHILKTE